MECPYVTDGYRNNLSYQQCLMSMFQLHNETVNIWTHFLPAVLCLPLAWYDITVSVPGIHGNRADYVTMAIFHLSCLIIFWASVYFHVFNAQGCRCVYEQCLGVDLWGIGVATCCYAVVYINYAFCCSLWWQIFYLSWIGCLITWYSVIWLHPRMVSSWLPMERRLLAYAPLFVVLMGALFLHPLILNRHWPNNLAQIFALHWMQPFAILVFGVVVFSLKIPERWWPGLFNIWGHSHQWWHIIIVVLQLFLRRGTINSIQMELHTMC
ncbi:progestin and adipoQ receptor family member 3-like [Branchiostoma lanceolatum]|uniref:progestin and adipoQ receptor family member 3-like n=1 Tax=Branchiostoma lanceolatum TaxID=7740 RepID=UPI003455CC7E